MQDSGEKQIKVKQTKENLTSSMRFSVSVINLER